MMKSDLDFAIDRVQQALRQEVHEAQMLRESLFHTVQDLRANRVALAQEKEAMRQRIAIARRLLAKHNERNNSP